MAYLLYSYVTRYLDCSHISPILDIILKSSFNVAFPRCIFLSSYFLRTNHSIGIAGLEGILICSAADAHCHLFQSG